MASPLDDRPPAFPSKALDELTRYTRLSTPEPHARARVFILYAIAIEERKRDFLLQRNR